MERDEIRVFAPATIANLGVGFNVLGLALGGLGNTVTARRSSSQGVRITSIGGDEGRLSVEFDKNPAGVAASATLEKAGIEIDVELEIRKNIPHGAGLGSSSAIAVAAAFAINKLMGSPLRKHELVGPCMNALGTDFSPCADQVAPALLGGLILVHSVKPLNLIRLPVAGDLMMAIAMPQMSLDLSRDKDALPKAVSVDDMVGNTANIAAFTSACFTSDMALLSRCIHRDSITAFRAARIPGCQDVIRAALNFGALGSSLCGAGPSVFALCRSQRSALDAAKAMQNAFGDVGIDSVTLISPADCPGARVER
jgi:homoserine kinase